MLWRCPSSKIQQPIDGWLKPVIVHKVAERKFLSVNGIFGFVPFGLGDRRCQVSGRSEQDTGFFKGLSDAR